MAVDLTDDTVAFSNASTGTRPAPFPYTRSGSGEVNRPPTLDRGPSPKNHDFLAVPITVGAVV